MPIHSRRCSCGAGRRTTDAVKAAVNRPDVICNGAATELTTADRDAYSCCTSVRIRSSTGSERHLSAIRRRNPGKAFGRPSSSRRGGRPVQRRPTAAAAVRLDQLGLASGSRRRQRPRLNFLFSSIAPSAARCAKWNIDSVHPSGLRLRPNVSRTRRRVLNAARIRRDWTRFSCY